MNWRPAKAAVAAYLKATKTATVHAFRCGLELLHLKAEHPEIRGGTAPGGAKTGRNPHCAGIETWAATVERELGISDDTAQRWMRAARGLLIRLGVAQDHRWWEDSKAAQKALFARITEVTKTLTLKQLAEEWLRTMAEAGAPDPTGNGGGSEEVPKIPLQLEISSIVKAAEKEAQRLKLVLLGGDMCDLWGDVPLFVHRNKDDVRAELAQLQMAVQLRSTWLKEGDEALRRKRQELLEQARQTTTSILELEIAKAEAERQKKAIWRQAGKDLKEGRAA